MIRAGRDRSLGEGARGTGEAPVLPDENVCVRLVAPVATVVVVAVMAETEAEGDHGTGFVDYRGWGFDDNGSGLGVNDGGLLLDDHWGWGLDWNRI